MCVDAMATEERKQRESNPSWWRRKKSVCSGGVKDAFRKYHVWRSPRKAGRRFHLRGMAWEKQRQTNAFQSGAMAPKNTTQYLMELVYNDLSITMPSSKQNTNSPHQHHTYSYTSPYTEEDTMDFQHRDFESVFFQNEI